MRWFFFWWMWLPVGATLVFAQTAPSPTPASPAEAFRALPPVPMSARIVFQEGFEGPYEVVLNPLEEPMGRIPQGWRAVVPPGARAQFGGVFADAPQGNAFFRLGADSFGREGGELTLTSPTFPLRRAQVLRLSLRLRSASLAAVRLRLVGDGRPTPYLEQEIAGRAEWSTGELVFQATDDDPRARLQLVFSRVGGWDFDDLVVAPFSPPATASAQAPTTPLGETRNLLPASSFPDGLTAPWTLLDAREWQTDTGELGPTGVPSLAFAGAGASLTAPWVWAGPGDYTFSLFAKGTVPRQLLSVFLGPPSANLGDEPFTQTLVLDTTWRRFVVTVPLRENPDGILLARLVSGPPDPIWVDGLMVEPGAEHALFRRAGLVEIALQSINPYGIHLEGEPLAARVTVYGTVAGVREVRGAVTDLEGKRYVLAPLRVNTSRSLRRALALDRLGEPPFGSYKVELQAFDVDGQAVSPLAELWLHRVRIPRGLNAEQPQSPLGVQVGFVGVDATELSVARALGFTWARDLAHLHWRATGGPSGATTFVEADRVLAAYQRFKFGVLASFGPAPLWAVDQPADFPLDLLLLPSSTTQWTTATVGLVEHYGNQIGQWEVWPRPYNERLLAALRIEQPTALQPSLEVLDAAAGQRPPPAPGTAPAPAIAPLTVTPDGAASPETRMAPAPADPKLVGTPATPAQLVELARAAQNAIGARRATVAVPVDLSADGRHVEPVLAAGLAEGAGALALHLRPAALPPAAIPREVLRRRLAALPRPSEGPRSQWWLVDGAPWPPLRYHLYESLPDGETRTETLDRAAEATRFVAEALEAGVDRLYLPLFPTFARGELWRPSARLTLADGRLHPSVVAVSNLAWLTEGKTLAGRWPATEGWEAFAFVARPGTATAPGAAAPAGGGGVAALLSPTGAALAPLALPTLAEAVAVLDLFGNPIAPKARTSLRYPVWLVAEGWTGEQLRLLVESLGATATP